MTCLVNNTALNVLSQGFAIRQHVASLPPEPSLWKVPHVISWHCIALCIIMSYIYITLWSVIGWRDREATCHHSICRQYIRKSTWYYGQNTATGMSLWLSPCLSDINACQFLKWKRLVYFCMVHKFCILQADSMHIHTIQRLGYVNKYIYVGLYYGYVVVIIHLCRKEYAYRSCGQYIIKICELGLRMARMCPSCNHLSGEYLIVAMW